MHRGKSVAFRMLFGKSACFVPEFLTLQGVEPGHLRVQAHRETAGYVLSYQEAYILSAPQQFNLLFFTLQISLFTRQKFHPKIFLTPLNISTLALILMLIFHLHFPRPLQTVCSNIGGITTPMALIIVGVMLADGNLLQIVTEKRAYVISLIRNLICPLIMLVVMALLPLDPNLRMAVLIYVACPVANLTSVYAIQHDMEPALCARATLLSTILFAATIPFIIWLGQLVYGV